MALKLVLFCFISYFKEIYFYFFCERLVPLVVILDILILQSIVFAIMMKFICYEGSEQ